MSDPKEVRAASCILSDERWGQHRRGRAAIVQVGGGETASTCGERDIGERISHQRQLCSSKEAATLHRDGHYREENGAKKRGRMKCLYECTVEEERV